jgi:hypothetical protein
MCVLDLDVVLSGRKIYTCSGITSLLPVFGGLRYHHLIDDARSRGYKWASETRIPSIYAMLVLRIYISGVRYLAKSSSVVALCCSGASSLP